MKSHISNAGLQLTFLGGAGFQFKACDTSFLIDPYLGGDAEAGFERITPSLFFAEDLVGADYLISTHGHIDHCDPALISHLSRKSDCRFLGPQSLIDKMLEAGVTEDCVTCLWGGSELQIGDVLLKVVTIFDPYEPLALGIMLEY